MTMSFRSAVAALAAVLFAPVPASSQGDCLEFASVDSYGDQVVATGPNEGWVSRWGSHPNWQSSAPRFVEAQGVRLQAVEVVAGEQTVYARLADGRVLSWGRDDTSSGSLGRELPPGDIQDEAPGFVRGPDGEFELTGVAGLAAGRRHVLARLDDGTLVAWGENSAGQLGDGANADSDRPVRVLDPSGLGLLGEVADIAAGAAHSLAARADGTLFSWGSNGAGQAGNGTLLSALPKEVLPPVGVSRLQDIVAVAAGTSHSFARRFDGTLLAWGRGVNGQLGTGDFNGSARPVVVLDETGTAPLAGVSEIAAGGEHGLAIAGGRVLSWGWNSQGQLGAGLDGFGLAERALPGPVLVAEALELTGVESLAAGRAHSLAFRRGPPGEILGWGAGDAGQLGDGSGLDAVFALTLPMNGAVEPSPVDREPGVVPLTLSRAGDRLTLAWGGETNHEIDVIAGSLGLLQGGGGFDSIALAGVEYSFAAEFAMPPGDAWFLALGGCADVRSSAGRNSNGVERILGTAPTDRDGDGIANVLDLCPDVADPDQGDGDGDGVGDACDEDTPVPDGHFLFDGAVTAPEAGGLNFRVLGAGFEPGDGLRFSGPSGSVEACEVQVQSSTEMTGIVPRYFTPGGPFPAEAEVLATRGVLVDDVSAVSLATGRLFRYYANPLLVSAVGPDGLSLVRVGDTVIVVGLNFMPERDVFVGSVEVSNSGALAGRTPGEVSVSVPFSIVDNNLLQFFFPMTGVGDFYDITIRTPRTGLACTEDYTFTLLQPIFHGGPPILTGLQPVTGAYFGGTEVVLTGDFSAGVTQVFFDRVNQSIVAQDATSVTVVTLGVPEATAGAPVDVQAAGPGGVSNVLAAAYTFMPQPDPSSATATSLDCGATTSPPEVVPVHEGQVLTVNGADFVGVNAASVGGVPATLVPVDDGEVQVIIPSEPMSGGPIFDVVLSATFEAGPTGSQDAPLRGILLVVVRYQDPPTVTELLPATANPGDFIQIIGADLRNVDGTPTQVWFDGLLVPPSDVSPTADGMTLLVRVPPGAEGRSVEVTVQTCEGSALSPVFFKYDCGWPQVIGIAPIQGRAGTEVVILGTNLDSPDGTPVLVFFGPSPAVVDLAASTPTELVVTAPVGIGAVTIEVTTCGRTDSFSSPPFSYCNAPRLDAVSPASGPPGTVVVLTGASFLMPDAQRPTVLFGGQPATVLEMPIPSNTTISVEAPAGSGTVDVRLETCGGATMLIGAYTYP